MNIWDLSKNKLIENKIKTAELEQKLNDEKESANENYLSEVRRRHESNIIIAGNRKSGKSSFQKDFIEKRDDLKESVGLEYLYARRTRGNVKDLCNLWELGGGHSVSQLLSIPITPKTVEITSLFIVVDMTKLDELWTTIERIVETSRKIVDNIHKNDQDIQKRMAAKMEIQLQKYDPSDLKMCNPCPVPLTIVASKYDEYQNFESEKRRNLCQYLRFLTFYYGANLMMYSSKMEQFAKIVKNITSHFAFVTIKPQGYIIDHNKAMFITCGGDQYTAIGDPPSSESIMRSTSKYELWKDSYCSTYPQKTSGYDTEESTKQDPMTDTLFKEPNIDNLVEIKRKELENHIRQKRDREAAEARAAERISKINLR